VDEKGRRESLTRLLRAKEEDEEEEEEEEEVLGIAATRI
jgi:hypothetical protein